MGFKVNEIKIEFNEQRHMPASFEVGKGNLEEIKVLENGVELVYKPTDALATVIPSTFYPIGVIFKLTYFVDL